MSPQLDNGWIPKPHKISQHSHDLSQHFFSEPAVTHGRHAY